MSKKQSCKKKEYSFLKKSLCFSFEYKCGSFGGFVCLCTSLLLKSCCPKNYLRLLMFLNEPRLFLIICSKSACKSLPAIVRRTRAAASILPSISSKLFPEIFALAIISSWYFLISNSITNFSILNCWPFLHELFSQHSCFAKRWFKNWELLKSKSKKETCKLILSSFLFFNWTVFFQKSRKGQATFVTSSISYYWGSNHTSKGSTIKTLNKF